MITWRPPRDMEMALNQLCLRTKRPKSFFLKEAMGEYLARTQRRMAKNASVKKKAVGKAHAKQRKKIKSPLDDIMGSISNKHLYDPLGDLVGKYGKGWPPSDVARNHNDIYDL